MQFFLRNINIDQKFIQQLEFEIFKRRNQIHIVREGDVEVVDPETKFRALFQKWQPIDLPKDSLPITTWLEYGLDDPRFLRVVNYALSRKIFDLENFYWSPERVNNLRDRLIIPYFYKGDIVGFTARLYYNPPTKDIPKYMQQCPTDFVYNLDNQQHWTRKYALVTEGVLDAWCTDGISILGEIGQEKIDIINRLQKQVIVCPDRDKKGGDLVDVAIENNWAVTFPKWGPHIKDAAHASEVYGRLLTVHSIISSATTGKLNIKIAWDLAQNNRNRALKDRFAKKGVYGK
jgi:hypothetical protein